MDRRFESRLDEGTETVRVPVSFPCAIDDMVATRVRDDRFTH
jgi:hypothetical protein